MTEGDAHQQLEAALRAYATELDSPSTGAGGSEGGSTESAATGGPPTVTDAELYQSIEGFASVHARLRPARPLDDHLERAPALESSPLAMRHLLRTAADFVTPADLARTDSLRTLGGP